LIFDWAEQSIIINPSPASPRQAGTTQTAMSFHYVYILRSTVEPDRHYIGLTRNLKSRLGEHNRGETPSTKAFAPWKIEVATAFRDRAKAAALEQYLKSHSGRAFSKRHF
jgi:predicted GIY-YIG superfamily endonuclease